MIYLIEGKYGNGDNYADKAYSIEELKEMLESIDNFMQRSRDDEHRIEVASITVTTEEEA